LLNRINASALLPLILSISILFFSFSQGHPVWAKDVPLLDPDRLFGFAMHLYNENDWYRAISEFKKFLFLYPRDPRTKDACYLIGISYKNGEKWVEAVVRLRRCALQYHDKPIGRKALLQIGETYYDSGRYAPALSSYQELIQSYPHSEEAQMALFKMGWAYLQLEKYKEAIEAFEAANSLSPHYERSLELADKVKETAPSIPRKSPTVAGILSGVVPGTGHIYSGELKNGVVSFLLNAIFITGAVVAFKNDLNVTGAIITFFELGWYFGGIYSAVEAAKESNERTRQGYLKSLDQTSYHNIQEEGGGLVVLKIPF
jgi:TolA-binding protein